MIHSVRGRGDGGQRLGLGRHVVFLVGLPNKGKSAGGHKEIAIGQVLNDGHFEIIILHELGDAPISLGEGDAIIDSEDV